MSVAARYASRRPRVLGASPCAPEIELLDQVADMSKLYTGAYPPK
jgi:hypothetical protein